MPLLALQVQDQYLQPVTDQYLTRVILEIRCHRLDHGTTKNQIGASKGRRGARLGRNNYYWVLENYFSVLPHKNCENSLSSNYHRTTSKIYVFLALAGQLRNNRCGKLLHAMATGIKLVHQKTTLLSRLVFCQMSSGLQQYIETFTLKVYFVPQYKL